MGMEPGGDDGKRDQASPLMGWSQGQRVVDEEGYRATVRYIGPVATAKDPESIWIGTWEQVWPPSTHFCDILLFGAPPHNRS